MTQSCFTDLSKEDLTQSQLNDIAARMPLHVLAGYLETLQQELGELPERIQGLQNTIQTRQSHLSCQACSGTLTQQLESLERELKELPVHIQRMQTVIAAKQQMLSSQEVEWLSVSRFADSYEQATLVQHGKTRNPMAMIRDEYKGMKLGDIAAEVLNNEPSLLTTTELTHRIYCTYSDDEFERARNSLSTELRVGAKAKQPRWRKCGRYAYAGLHIPHTAT